MKHSLFFSKHVKEFVYQNDENVDIKEQRIDISALIYEVQNARLSELQELYSNMGDLFRETNDAQFGIVSGLVEVAGTTPVEYQWVRDATRSLPLDERMPHDAPVIEANNALLRCLSRVRPIDYAIDKKYGDNKPGPRCRELLQAHFEQCTQAILSAAQSDKSDTEKLKQIEQLERKFNTALLKVLHEANLAQGCDNKEDAEHLLFHYRNLSSLIEDPARAMVTLTYDQHAGILQRETQYPVTEKTAKQHETMKELSSIQLHPFDNEKNAHNSKNSATQEADALFAELMDKDTTALSAQARKTHLVGAKNAFIVKNELIQLDELPVTDVDLNQFQATDKNTLWLARTGVPVYVGSGEKIGRVDAHTQENLEQIRMAAVKRIGIPNPKLHITCLNTYSPLENQMKMVDSLYRATRGRGQGDEITYAPTNPDGTFRRMDIAPNLLFEEGEKPSKSIPLQKKDRLEQVSKIVLAAANTDSTVSVVQCASGQDRTGTAVEKATQSWMSKCYAAMGKDPSHIETMRAEGGNAAEITTHHIHGSPGMKTESMANNFFGGATTFSDAAAEQFYRDSANTNKKNKADNVDFLSVPSKEAIKTYERNLRAFEISLDIFEEKINNDPKKRQCYASGLDLLSKIKKIGSEDKLSAQSLAELNEVLPHCTYLLNHHDRAGSPEFKENIMRLARLSNYVSGSSSPGWKALGICLITFACLGLVAAGILAAIPTAGASVILAVSGATGIAVSAVTAAGFCTVAGSATAGIIAVKVGSEKGLAYSISDFKSHLDDIKENVQDSSSENEYGCKF